MILRAIVVLIATALPAAAELICDPPKGTGFTVSGVAANDTLNMRSGPSSKYEVVSRIRPDEQGVKATGRVAWGNGQCTKTCEGAEGGLNDKGRAIAYNCKANGGIWYEVRRKNGAVGWASGKFLDPIASGGGTVPPPATGPGKPGSAPEMSARLHYDCVTGGRLRVEVAKDGETAEVTIAKLTYLVLRKSYRGLPISFAAGDGARLRGNGDLVEWRWPDGRKTKCAKA